MNKNSLEIVGFKECIIFDTSKPDSTYRKVMDISKIEWKPKNYFKQAIEKTYKYFLESL